MPGNNAFGENFARRTAYSCVFDSRFVYYVYVPRNWLGRNRPERYRLVVLVHGTERAAENYRNRFMEFAEETDSVILAPLFPVGLGDPDMLENYNFLRLGDAAFDTVLLHMMDEVNNRFPVDTSRVFLHGFSAGGQFVHRFMYLYPERLARVSIGGPGKVTLLDGDKEWPAGIGGVDGIFSRSVDLEALRRIPVQIVVGDADIEIHNPASSLNRVELNQALFENYRAAGMNARLDLVPGVGHEGLKVLSRVMAFFREGVEGVEPQ